MRGRAGPAPGTGAVWPASGSDCGGGRPIRLATVRAGMSLIRRVTSFTISRDAYSVVTAVALGSLATIVLTGAAVRLTGSGLGCPDWPKCYGGTVPPAELNAVIEYGNRILPASSGSRSSPPACSPSGAGPTAGTWRCSAALLPLGVIAQAVLGALVVKYHLAPGLVMGHFILSMMLLDAAFALAWCSRYEPDERRRSSDRLGVWAVRALVPLGQLTILAGTISTASGPHPGAHKGELVQRFDFKGGDTLQWVVERHAASRRSSGSPRSPSGSCCSATAAIGARCGRSA